MVGKGCVAVIWRDYVGACCNIVLGLGCNTVTVEQIAGIFGMNCANCDTDTNIGM